VFAGAGHDSEYDRIFIRDKLAELLQKQEFLNPLIQDVEVYAPCQVVLGNTELTDR